MQRIMIDKLRLRLFELQEQRNQAQKRLQQAGNDIIAIDGAIQEIMYWLAKLEKEQKEESGVNELNRENTPACDNRSEDNKG